MADRNYIIIFPEVETVTRKFSDEQLGALMRGVFGYGFRGVAYETEDPAQDVAFQFIASQLDRAEEKRKEMSRLAKKRWNVTSDADVSKMNADASKMDAPIHSNPVQSRPDQSSPDQSIPDQSRNTQKNNIHDSENREGKGAAAPAHAGKKSFGKFGWVKLSQQEYDALEQQLGETELKRCIDYLDQSAQATGNKNRWRDFGLVIQRCSQEGWGLQRYGSSQEKTPMGATGFSKWEMDAIKRMNDRMPIYGNII